MDNWRKLVTLSIMVLVCGCLESYHFAVLVFLLFSIGLVFRQMNISVPDEASSSSSSTSSSSSSSSISVPDETSSSSSSTSLSSSSSVSFSKGSLYDVFISFRGEDTRKVFTGHLYEALTKAGVNAFIDDEELKRGENITTALGRAIQGSKISLIVFSRRYADSSWCLEELVHIMECRTTLGQIVIPIFYKVDPSHVRKQTGSFAQSFLKHTDKKKVARWRAALTEAASLAGFVATWAGFVHDSGSEARFISEIASEVIRVLNKTYLDVAPYQVGIDSRVQDISKYVVVGDSNDVRVIGISGMGGIGKTTIAKAVYNKFYDKFERKSFLEKVREKAVEKLQKQLLSDILQTTKTKVNSVAAGTALVGERFRRLKVLVIFDDVDDVKQLRELAGNRHSFGPGSRIIITTRNEHMLQEFAVDKTYPAKGMEQEEALELLSWHAFESKRCPSEYLELARKVVDYCGGLPLALQVLGSTLFKRSIGVWKSTLDKLDKIPPEKIHEQLKISYDGLNDDYEREIFRDISCFFIGMDKTDVMQILDGCGFSATAGIEVLHERCLVTVNRKNKLMMHDLLRDMGREIVRAENPKYPEKRSRVWRPEDVKALLIDNSGTQEIEGLSLNLPSLDEETSFSTEAFTNMKRLRLLQLKYIQLIGGYQCLSKKLKWLCWRGFPLKFIPKDLCQPNIVAIDMRYSSLRQVLCEESGLLYKLKILNLSHSHDLTRSPDFSKLPNLEKLILKGCKRLSNVHESIGDLKSLALVNLEGCEMLKELPRTFYKLKSAKILVLKGCSRFKNLSEDLGKMSSLTTLVADETAITEVPSSIGLLEKLESLSLRNMRSSLKLPPSLMGMHALRELDLSGGNLKEIPNDISSLSSLVSLLLDRNGFHSLPSFSSLSRLQRLSLNGCEDLVEITDDLPPNLSLLSMNDCTALERMANLSGWPRVVALDGSSNLIEFQGLDRALNTGMILGMRAHNRISEFLFKDSTLQGWTGTGYIYLRANHIPTWFNNVNKKGDRVCFQLPHEIGYNLKALAVCFSCRPYELNSPLTYSISVINHTKCTCIHADVSDFYPPARLEEYLWMGHFSNKDFKLEGGDSVHVIVQARDTETGFIRVEKTGVRLVSDKRINFSFSSIDYGSIPYGEAINEFSINDDDDHADHEDDDVDDHADHNDGDDKDDADDHLS
ncbi:disease resistance protein RPV1-like [Malus sylvestris]|uniref:disease resistance protein RPV1-like n=1 Tax=Malus sylvestris TaxID=3752 RepID=UPI0021ABE0CC|nr:disease resistance protein RPV1-like [Malus sylvestris]